MCFSASASFGASALLATLSYCALKKRTNNNQLLLYSTPALFAIQQAIEGLLWLTVYNAYSHLNIVLMYGFLFFAFVVWPSWVPIALYTAENNQDRKTNLLLLSALGLSCSAYFLYRLIYFNASVTVDTHLNYMLFIPEAYYIPLNIWYGFCSVVPFFISTIPYGWLIGLLLAISYVITYHFYYCCLISVWCFFAALISALIVVIAYVQQKQTSG